MFSCKVQRGSNLGKGSGKAAGLHKTVMRHVIEYLFIFVSNIYFFIFFNHLLNQQFSNQSVLVL